MPLAACHHARGLAIGQRDSAPARAHADVPSASRRPHVRCVASSRESAQLDGRLEGAHAPFRAMA